MKNRKSLWSLIFLLLLIFLMFYFLLRGHEIGKLVKTAAQTNPLYLIAGLFLMFIFVASEGVGIQVLLNALKYRQSFRKCLKYSFIGFYYCNITPSSGGQPVQIYYMTKEGIEFGDSSLCIMLISIAYQIGILFICLFALITRYGFIMSNLGVVRYFSIFGALVNLFGVAFFVSTTFHNNFLELVVSLIIKLLTKLRIIKEPDKWREKINVQLERYRDGARFIRKNPRVLLITLLTIIIQILSRLSVAYAVYKAFGLNGCGFLDILALQAFLALGVEYLPIPGSVGAAEAGFYKVNGVIFGSDRVIPATLLTRGISFYAFLLISGTVSIFAHISLTRRLAREKETKEKAEIT